MYQQRYLKKEEKFKDNWVKAFSLIWENYCAADMQIAIKEMSDYDAAVHNEPLELLKCIKTLMHTPERAKYPSLTLVEVLLNMLKVKQGDKEELIDYLSWF